MLDIKYLTEIEYKELGGEDYPSLSKYINRANLDIFRMIGITTEDFIQLQDIKQFYIKMATFDQTLYLISTGIETSVTGGQVDTVKIGQYSEGTANAVGARVHTGYADTVIEWLDKAGLVNRFGSLNGGDWYGYL